MAKRRVRYGALNLGSTAPDAALVTSAVVAVATTIVAVATTDGLNNAGRNREHGQCENDEHSNFHDLLLAVAVPFRAVTGLTQWMAISTTRFISAETLSAVATRCRVSPVQRVSTRSAETLL